MKNFTVHLVIGDVFHPDGLERPRPNMQRDVCNHHPHFAQSTQHIFIEMQAGSGRRDGARLPSRKWFDNALRLLYPLNGKCTVAAANAVAFQQFDDTVHSCSKRKV